jgi:hypothetical protein
MVDVLPAPRKPVMTLTAVTMEFIVLVPQPQVMASILLPERAIKLDDTPYHIELFHPSSVGVFWECLSPLRLE